jgi:uncharacterized protein YkwD
LLRLQRRAWRLFGLCPALLCLSIALATPAFAQEPAGPAAPPDPAAPAAPPPAEPAAPEAAPQPAPPPAEAPPAAPPVEPQPAQPPAPDVPAEPDLGALLANPNLEPVQRLQLELLRQINGRRAEAGRAPLALDQRLVDSATEHSRDMAAHRRCRHGGSDGSSARARMQRHGYPFNNWAGENIICSRRTVDAAMSWWMNSRPHRKNILHGHYTHIGIGIDPNGPYGAMWTLNFAAGAPDTVRPVAFDAPVPAEPAPAEPPAVAEQPAPAEPAPAEPVASSPPADAGPAGEPAPPPGG